jgi:cytochrome c
MKKIVLSLAFVGLVGFRGLAQSEPPADVKDLLQKHTCFACHKVDTRLVGPAYKDVAKKKYTPEQIAELVYNPKPADWPGYPPMAALKNVPKDDLIKIGKWINSLAGGKKK